MRLHAEPGGDLLCTEPAFLRQFPERLELVGGMYVFPSDVLVEADFVRIVRGVDDASDRLGLLDFLTVSACLADMIILLLGLGCRAHLAPAALPVGETGVARARAAEAEGDRPACTSGLRR
jgi:hypothetical protein